MRTNSRALRALTGAVVGLLAACANVNKDPPAPPRFDLAGQGEVTSRLPTMTLAGSAEYGATLALASDTGFDGKPAPAAQSADPYTARFSYPDVALARGKNTFTLKATDAAGNTSTAGTLVVTYADVPAGLELTLSAPAVTAGTEGGAGQITATARVLGGVEGFKLAGRDVEFTLAGVGSGTRTATTDAHGRATASFTGLTSVGVGTVSAAVKGSTDLTDSASFVVTSGAAASLGLSLRKATDTGSGTSALTITGGDEVVATVTVKDGAANAVDAPVQLFTDAPGALVAGLTIRNLRGAGTFHVVAAVSGVPTAGGMAVSAAATVTVLPGGPATITFEAPATAVAGEAFAWTTRLADAFGNALDAPAGVAVVLSSSTDTGLTSDAALRMATLTKAGTQLLTATLTGVTPAPAVTRGVVVAAAAPSRLTVTLTGTDKNPATPDLEIDPAADSAVGVQTAVTDRFLNPLAAAVTVSTDAPGLFDGTTLRGITRAGLYTVVATVANTTVAAKKSFTVNALKATSLLLDLSAPQVTAGAAVTYSVRAVDAFANLTAEPVALSVDGLAATDYAVDGQAKTLTVGKASATALTVRAKATAAGSTLANATAPLLVRAGAPAAVVIDSGPTQTLQAGATPPFTATVSDALGNVIANPPVTLSVLPLAGTVAEPPGPMASGGRIYNLIRPGSYLLSAQVAGTSLANDPSDPRATLTVTAGDAAAVDLVLSRPVADAGSPVDFKVAVKDAYGNAAAGVPVVSASQGSTVVAPVVAGTSFTAGASGSYTLTATLVAGSKTLTDTEALTVVDAPDTQGPALAFVNPASDPTVPSWPPPGATSPASCPGAGDVLGVTATDPSLVADVWLGTAGVASPMTSPPMVTFPASPLTLSADVCTAAAGTPARGEVLVNLAASDLRGNYRLATGGWCVDPDATAYLPANPVATRCVVARQDAGTPNVFALAANDAGELAVAREAGNGDAFVHLFKRTAAYGLGAAHAIAGYAAPRGVALVGNTAFTSVVSTSKMVVSRTRSLDKAGAGTDDVFVTVDSSTDRFDGVVVGLDGSLYALAGGRVAGTFASKLYRFDKPLDLTRSYAALPTATASSATVRLTGLCKGPRATELYATGLTQTSGGSPRTVPTLVKITLATGAITTVFTDTVDQRLIGGCAVTGAGIAVTLSKGTGNGTVTLVDPATGALAATALMTGYSASAAFDKLLGLATAQGYLFAATNETPGSSLVRFARPGGF